ncbi:MAG TPA: hypothetical protein VGJ48_24455 [Pyrinomonadaceae bacterium]|jgi:hypothetical protein
MRSRNQEADSRRQVSVPAFRGFLLVPSAPKIVALVFGLLLLPAPGTAQEDTERRAVVSLAAGGFVAFKSETAWAGATNTSAAVQELPGEFKSWAFIDEDDVIHRVLVDEAGKYIFGYDLLIQAIAASKTFNIAVKPLDFQIENKLLRISADGQPTRIATLLQSSEPQILDEGDSFRLDLLVNQKTGVKIVDFVRVSFERSNLDDDNPRTVPRDFTVDAVALTVKDYRLLIDGNLFAAGKPGTNFAGALIWYYVEGHGRFIFSLVPRAGYEFQKVGIIEENRIEFTVKGSHYEWLSDSPILPGGGTWNVWVLHDPKYVPFGSQEIVKREKNRLDKLDDSIKAALKKGPKKGDPAPATFHNKTAEVERVEAPKRFKVMVGAADHIENLWPRNR